MKLAKNKENYLCELLLMRMRGKYSVVELAKKIGVSKSEIYRLCERGRINLSNESYYKIINFAKSFFSLETMHEINTFWIQSYEENIAPVEIKPELVSAKTLMELADEGLSIGAASRRLKVCSEAHLGRIIKNLNDAEMIKKFKKNAILSLKKSRPAARRYG